MAMISASNTSWPIPIPGTRDDRGGRGNRGSIRIDEGVIASPVRDMAERSMKEHCGDGNASRQ